MRIPLVSELSGLGESGKNVRHMLGVSLESAPAILKPCSSFVTLSAI